jgi:hypothetical protein
MTEKQVEAVARAVLREQYGNMDPERIARAVLALPWLAAALRLAAARDKAEAFKWDSDDTARSMAVDDERASLAAYRAARLLEGQ